MLREGPSGFGVGTLTGNAVPTIQAQIDAAAAVGGGWVLLSPGLVYDIDGTDAITGIAYNPISDKPVVSVIGAVGARLVNVVVRGGKIDGNGVNQPDLGSYANVAVHEADYTIVDVESVNARPGTTINEPIGGANTGGRALCLFVGHALKTTVRGICKNVGYDSIGLREGSVDTLLDNVAAHQAAKGAIQVATGALRTKILGGIYDNFGGGTDASHAIFGHSAVWMDVIGATTRANTGSCLVLFGDATWGNSKEINIGNCAMEHTGAVPMVSIPTAFTEKINIHDITFRKTGTEGGLLYMAGATKQFVASRWAGTSASTASAFQLNGITDFELVDMDMECMAAGNQSINLESCQRGRITGKYKQVSGVGAYAATSANIKLEQVKLTCSDSVQFLGGNTNMDSIQGVGLVGHNNAGHFHRGRCPRRRRGPRTGGASGPNRLGLGQMAERGFSSIATSQSLAHNAPMMPSLASRTATDLTPRPTQRSTNSSSLRRVTNASSATHPTPFLIPQSATSDPVPLFMLPMFEPKT